MKKAISLARVCARVCTHTSNLIETKTSFEKALILMHIRDS